MDKKIAVVTGATKGIGFAIAQKLILDGYYVLGTHVRDYDDDYKKKIENDNFKLIKLDVKDYDGCLFFSKQIKSDYGRIDVLINNAGIVKDSLLMMMDEKSFSDVVETNLKGVFNMTQAFSKMMLRQKQGAIVNITSVIGSIGNAGQSNYAASKAGIIGFSKSIAKEFASRGIRVNCVNPGFIDTEMTQALDDNIQETIKSQIALNRFGTSQDIANAVSFLVSDQANYITGQVLNVCGGLVI